MALRYCHCPPQEHFILTKNDGENEWEKFLDILSRNRRSLFSLDMQFSEYRKLFLNDITSEYSCRFVPLTR